MRNLVKSFLILCALVFTAIAALADSQVIQAQYGAPAGFFDLHVAHPGCMSPVGGQAPCIAIIAPMKILGWSGTITAKVNGVEPLSRVVCSPDGTWNTKVTTLFAGEQIKQGTIIIQSPSAIPLLTGSGTPFGYLFCWFEYQIGNSGTATPDGGALEVQFTIFYE